MKRKNVRKRQPKKLPGITNANIQILSASHEKMKVIQEARRRNTGRDPRLCGIYSEAVEQYLERTDLETGMPKPALAGGPPSPSIVLPARFPRFGEYVDCNQFADDADLCQAMDECSWLMLWAAGPNLENLHVNRLLVAYAGRSVPEFSNMGWLEALHPADREPTLETCRAGFKLRQPYSAVYRMRRRDWQYGWIVDHAQPRYRPDGSFAGYVGTMYQVPPPDTHVEMLAYEQGRWVSRPGIIVPGSAPPRADDLVLPRGVCATPVDKYKQPPA
jgi:PAS domain-containing protein